MSYELYVVTDEEVSHGRTHQEIARQAIAGGADVVQLRDKRMSGKELYAAAADIRRMTRESGTMFIVNDRLDVALAAGADGVHLGQDDLPLRAARMIAPSDFIIGMSVGSVEEAVAAEEDGADYIALSPLFATPSKRDAGPGCGLDVLRAVRSAVSVPLIAIGGVGKGNVGEVIRTGADGVAVISAVVSREDIAAAARELRSLVLDAKRRGAR